MSAEARGGRWWMPTRDLLACAAIGVVCGLVMVPVVYLQVSVTATVPVLYTIFTGTFILGPVLAQALVRRPGAAFVGAVVAGLASAPFSPRGIIAVLPMVLVAVVFEAVAATGRYRRWPAWRWYLGALLLSCFSIVTFIKAYDLLSLQPVLSAVTIAAIPVSYLSATALAVFVSARLARTGIGFRPLGTDADTGYVAEAVPSEDEGPSAGA